MRRIIKDYKNITPELLEILNDRYPEGIDEDDLITFMNHQNEKVKAVEIRFEDDIYLIKVSKQLADKMDEALEDDEEEMDDELATEVDTDLDDVEEEMDEEDDEEEEDEDDEDDD